MKQELVVYGVLAFVSIEYLVFVVNVTNHIADLLQISIFKVFTPKEDASKWLSLYIEQIEFFLC